MEAYVANLTVYGVFPYLHSGAPHGEPRPTIGFVLRRYLIHLSNHLNGSPTPGTFRHSRSGRHVPHSNERSSETLYDCIGASLRHPIFRVLLSDDRFHRPHQSIVGRGDILLELSGKHPYLCAV